MTPSLDKRAKELREMSRFVRPSCAQDIIDYLEKYKDLPLKEFLEVYVDYYQALKYKD